MSVSIPTRRFAVLAAVLSAGLAGTVSATTITIVNNNAAGVGFNDTSAPNAAAGCQVGENVGACRLRVFQTAANQWSTLLNSNVTIVVTSQMVGQTCTATSATLGSAGPASYGTNFPNAPRSGVSYAIAEANAIAGSDLSGGADINATFNVSIDTACLTGTTGWWYGTDPAVAAPVDRIPLLPVVFHELGHGLGFIAPISASGAYGTSGQPIWASYLYDTQVALLWKDMTNAQRAASSINDPNLVWTGARTNKQAANYLKPGPALIINSPPSVPTPDPIGTAPWGQQIGVGFTLTSDLVWVADGVLGVGTPAGTTNDGCETPFTNAAAMVGKIAFIDRGFCNFTVKAKNAQLAGAIAVIIGNVATSTNPNIAPGLGGSDPTVTIPAIGISFPVAEAIRTALGTGPVNITIGTHDFGRTSGCVRLFAPNPLQSGSSVSHYHSDASPNLLMEPAITSTIFNKVDLTLPLFKDIDWPSNLEDFLFIDNFDPNPCINAQP
jgi:PA domain